MMMGASGYCDHDMKVRMIWRSESSWYYVDENDSHVCRRVKFLSRLRQQLGGWYYFPIAIFFPVLDVSNSNLLSVQSVDRMLTCPCDNADSENPLLVVILRAGSPFRKWSLRFMERRQTVVTSWLNEGEELFDNNTFVIFGHYYAHHLFRQIRL